jgi:hypothetical protein
LVVPVRLATLRQAYELARKLMMNTVKVYGVALVNPQDEPTRNVLVTE